MIQIIPNWHPIFVHLTVGLFSASCIFYVASYLSTFLSGQPGKIISELEVAGRWCLWTASLITIGTVLAGFYAFNTINHDEPAHIVMITHRNLALTTATSIFFLAIWAIWRYSKVMQLTASFILALLIVQALLLTTAWYGAELVFRHGLGVMSLPSKEGEEHHHHHSNTMESHEVHKE